MLQYDRAWNAINQLLRAGRAFSGNERKCAYLNVQGGRFANVSAAWNLDFTDDGRGMAACDWDFDGDLDIWTANRTGPPVRLLRNENPPGGGHLSLLLRGSKSHRDAIGARVEVYLPEQTVPLLRTRHAGDGFLSQSSKWLHFGLGDAKAIDKIVVRWPGGAAETFSGGEVNGRYLLVENYGKVEAWQGPPVAAAPLTASPFERSKPVEAARAVLLRPALFPQVSYIAADGKATPVAPRNGRSLLVNLWAPWCKPCLVEMKAWAAAREALDAAEVDVLAICVDEPTADPAADAAKHAQFAAGMAFPFAVGVPQGDLVDMFEVVQRTYFVRQSPLPIPTSFLIDPEGRVSVIYKGPVEPDQLVADARLRRAGEEERVFAAIPAYGGRFIDLPKGTGSFAIASMLLSAGDLAVTERYLKHIIADAEPRLARLDRASPQWAELKTDAIKSYDLLGRMAFDAGKYRDALAEFDKVLAADPLARAVRSEAVRAHLALNELEPAARHVETLLEAHRQDPDNLVLLAGIRLQLGEARESAKLYEEALQVRNEAPTRYRLAAALLVQRKLTEALAQYRAALELVPDYPPAANDLAWVLATHPDARFRDGQRAVALARAACKASSHKDPNFLNTLAVALAETGGFPEAIDVCRQAIAAAESLPDKGATKLVPTIEARIALFQQGKPHRDPALAEMQ